MTRGKTARDRRQRKARAAPAAEPRMADGLALFVVIFAVSVLAILALQVARRGSPDEGWDKAIAVTAGMLAVACAVWVSAGGRIGERFRLGAAAVSVAGMLVGIGAIEIHPGLEMLHPVLWLGWGPWVLLLALILSPVAWRVVEWHSLPRWLKLGLGVVAVLVCAADLVSLWQTRTSVIEPFSSEYIMNEMLAPAAGHVPYADFIPQYQLLPSWMIRPLAGFLSADQMIDAGLALLNVLGILALVLGVRLAHLALGKRSLTLATLLVVPFTCVVPFPRRAEFSGSIAAQLSGLPVRICFGMILAVLLLPQLHRLASGSASTARLVAIGAFGGVYLWTSQDFGLAAVVTTIFLMVALPGVPGALRLRVLGTTAAGLAAGLASYPLMARAAGHPLDPATFGFFVRQFGGGFGAEPIRLPGPVLVILPLILAIALVSLHLVWGMRKLESTPRIQQARYAALTGAFFGCWSTLGLSYYLNRSFASGQMQVLFLPVAVGFAGVLGLMLALDTDVPALRSYTWSWRGPSDDRRRALIRSTYPLTLLVALFLATALMTPNPAYEKQRLSGDVRRQHLPLESVAPSVQEAVAAKAYADSVGSSIGYFGEFANYIELASGVRSVNLFNNPRDFGTGPAAVPMACARLADANPDVLVLGEVGRAFFLFRDNTLCERYVIAPAPGVREGYFARRIGG